MGKHDPRIDAYIAGKADFAKPVLNHLRALVHQTVPEVEETIKWGMPFFMHHGMLCHMAAFKQHCSFRLHQAEAAGITDLVETEEGMGQFGRITRLEDLPADRVLSGYLQTIARYNTSQPKSKAKAPKAAAAPKAVKADTVPGDLAEALKADEAAARTFANFTAAQRRDYIAWLEEAKQEATRQKRLQTTLEWLALGKPRNWKYAKR